VASAFYLPTSDDGDFLATEHTRGPWGPGLQHGGPPSALLARAVEREEQQWPSTVVRMAVEILGPVPVGPLSVASHVARSGRSVEMIEAELSAGGRVAVRARAWRVRLAELDLPAGATLAALPPVMPDADDPPPEGWPDGFINAMQCRFTKGGWNSYGPATLWARLRWPLVDGEAPSGLQRLMTLADCGNGISTVLPMGNWVFINPDLTVHLARYPAGEWLCLDAATSVDPNGFGLATSTLYDAEGRVGAGAQSLFVDKRE
jgi:hypothetical protein